MADPQRQAEEARAWFASWRAWFGSFRRPSRLPPGLLYVLDDDRSRRIARRRVFIAIILPAILTLVTVMTGASFVIHKTGKSYYVDPKDPHRTQRSVEPLSHDERPFNFYLHGRLNLWGPGPPPTWEYVEEVTSSKARFAPPPELDPFAVTAGTAPLLVLIFGYGTSALLLEIIMKRSRARWAGRHIQSSLRVAKSMPSAICGLGSWVWFFGIIYLLVVASGDLQCLSDALGAWLLLGSLAAWLMSGVVGPLTYVRFDRSGVVFTPWYLFCVLSMVVSVGSPFLVWFILMKLLW